MIGGWDDCTLKTMSLFILIVAAKQDFRRRAKPRHRADSSDRFSYKLRHMARKGFEYVPGLKANLESKGWWQSFELPDGRRIDGVNTSRGGSALIAANPTRFEPAHESRGSFQ